MKKLFNLLRHRCVVVGMALIFQISVFLLAIYGFNEYFFAFYWLCIAFSTLAVLWIIGNKSNPAYKIAWIIPILVFPVFGGFFYLVFGGSRLNRRTRRQLKKGMVEVTLELSQDCKAEILSDLGEDAVIQGRYLEKCAMCPVYGNTETTYYPLGEDMFEAMLIQLEQAERYIFLEYFIIQEGEMWDSVLRILREKAKAGVEVRIIYDDMGSLFTLPQKFPEQMERDGIHCIAFNRFVPILTLRLNNRDHRKVLIIDGKVGFTGGINLADEYINRRERFGHWKDGGILLRGDGVWSMAVVFLSMWHLYRDTEEGLEWFRPRKEELPGVRGFVQPYTDSPLDEEPVGQTVYLNLIHRDKRYVYIMTPYLILDAEMENALKFAARRGVDVSLILPGIPDKAMPYALAKSHYKALLSAGVKIYEYSPGFVHAKVFVSDDIKAVVGTINLDYRSLSHHFECATYMHGTDCIADIEADFEATLESCRRAADQSALPDPQ